MKETDRERAKQKEQLRRGMTVTPDKEKKPETKKKTDREKQADREKQPEKDELDIKLRRYRIVRGALLAILVLLVVGGLLIWQMQLRSQDYVGHSTSWEKNLVTTGRDIYMAYGEYAIRYNRDGITYINGKGEPVWSQTFEMSDPVAVVNGNYIAVIDRGGYSMYICDLSGCTGTVSTILPMHKVTVSAAGVIALAVQDDLADKVYFYDSTGRKIDIEMMTLLTQDGYTLDMSLSPDGKQLVSAYVYLDQGTMKNQVVFRNFGEEGQDLVNRLVGGFRDYEGELIGRVTFLSDVYACVFAQDRICFYSLKNRRSPELVEQLDYTAEISSVFYTSEHVGVISEGSNSVQKKLTVYGQDGRKVTEFETDFAYTGANFSGGRIVLYNATRCEMFDFKGEPVYGANMGTDIRFLSCLGEDRILIIDGQTTKEVVLEKSDDWKSLWD